MAYGNLNVDVVQSSTSGTPPQFNDGNGTQVGTLCRSWVNFNGSSASIRASFNVSSVVRNGAGDYTVNFASAMPDLNYSVTTTGSTVIGGGASNGIFAYEHLAAGPTFSRTTSAVRVLSMNTSFTGYDNYSYSVSVFR